MPKNLNKNKKGREITTPSYERPFISVTLMSIHNIFAFFIQDQDDEYIKQEKQVALHCKEGKRYCDLKK